MPIKGILLFVFFVGSLPVCLARPFYGILLWTIIAFLNPQSSLFYWHAADTFPWAVAVAVPTLIGFALFSHGWKNLASGKVMMMALLWDLVHHHIVHQLAYAAVYSSFRGYVVPLGFCFQGSVSMTVITIAILDTFDRLA